jgi:hypothetical protein
MLFLAGSVLYVAIGIRDGDWLMVIASAGFGIGVLLLLVPDRFRMRRLPLEQAEGDGVLFGGDDTTGSFHGEGEAGDGPVDPEG